ncbi:leukemia inhibitory factor receptor-like [Diretmus argenteus]
MQIIFLTGVIQCGPQTITLQRRFLEQVGIAWLTWQDDPSCSTLQDQLVYEVQVLRAGNPVHHDSVVVPTEQIGSTHSWAWTSSLPLECVSHSFRLRSLYQNHTSPWSKAETIPGVTSRKEPKVFPKDRLVEVGTNLTFCCILDAGERLERMQVQGYDDDSLKTTKISNQTYALTVHLNAPSGTSYPPADQDLQCETRDLQLVECRWNSGRDTHLIKKTVYRLQESCKHMARVIVGERNWTLTATNKLGRSVLTDRADLTKRVRMFAPENVMASSVNARSASLKWQWTAGKYKLLDLLCQLQLSHGELTDRVNSSGVGLGFTVLLGLIPSQTYTVQVRCGAKEHFWTWGDWSTSHTFKTKDDIPDALDVWMLQEQNQPVTITWKTLLANQSHGQILDYEVTWGKTGENERRTVTIYPPENSVALRLDAGEEHVVAVTARNLNGSSSPSAVIIPRFDPDKESVKPSKISGTDGGFHVSWSADPEAICGYVVAWYPTFSKCKVEWLKVPAGVTNARILSETFRPGVRYSLFIHACTSGAPKLLERRDGYVRETKLQDKQIKGLKWKQMGSDVQVSWRAISPRNQTAFIQGYIMYYNDSIHQKTLRTADGLITVIVSLVGVFSLISFASLVTVLCYRHWGWGVVVIACSPIHGTTAKKKLWLFQSCIVKLHQQMIISARNTGP